MRALLVLTLFGLLLAPLSSAASLSSEIVSSSPIDLFGRLTFQNDGLRIFHQAPRDATMRGTVYNGTLFEHRRIVTDSCPDSRAPREEDSVVSDVRGGDLANILRLELGQHALVIFEPRSSKDLVLSDGSATQANVEGSTPPLHLAPNTYVQAEVENSTGRGIYAGSWSEAFSQNPFLLLPTARFDSTLAGLLTLESGDLRVSRGEQTKIYRPHFERRDVDCNATLALTKGHETTTYSYTFLIDTGTLSFEQSGLPEMRDYFAGERDLERPKADRPPFPPPAGYWYQNDGPALTEAYDGLALPHTYLTAPRIAIQTSGAARLRDAFGSITDNETITEVDRKDIVLSGNLVVTPVAADDGGRRMTSRIEGTLFVLDIQADGVSTDWTPLVAAAAAGAIGLGLVAFTWPGLKWKATQLLLFPLYARLKKEDILENPLRDDILHVVQTTPGISASDLGRRLECGWGTLVYHITVLERMGLVSSAREGRHKRFFAQGRINYSDKGAVALLANPAARTILDAIRHHPGIIQKELGERLGLAAGTISWHIERLTGEGLVLKEEDGRAVRYFPSERLLDLTRELAA
jgi:DNA-binding transcriptional ArsR family regulator